MSKTEAREYLKAKGALKQRLIDLAYGRPYGSKPILVPLSKALKAVDETSKTFLDYADLDVDLNHHDKLVLLDVERVKWFVREFGLATTQKPSKEKEVKS